MKKVLLFIITSALIIGGYYYFTEYKTNKDNTVNIDKYNYSNIYGTYMDETSKRATLEISATNGKSATAVVSWGSSATETSYWTMTIKYNEGKLEYNDCKSYNLINGEEEILYTDGKGYFEVIDDEIRWTGAIDSNTKECVFKKEK